MNYKSIRGSIATTRCKNVSTYGSPLYCDCGCHTPQATDPQLDTVLAGVTVGVKDQKGYADVALMRNGKRVGYINTQHNYICIDGNEYIGCEGIDGLLTDAINVLHNTAKDDEVACGDTLEETAARVHQMERIEDAEQDAANKNRTGYCTKCHSYCYGDCEAN